MELEYIKLLRQKIAELQRSPDDNDAQNGADDSSQKGTGPDTEVRNDGVKGDEKKAKVHKSQ